MNTPIPHDSTTKQLYALTRRSAKTFASGYVHAFLDLNTNIGEQHLVQLVMEHIDRVLAGLAEQFGIDWTEEDTKTIEMDIREVCLKHFKPF